MSCVLCFECILETNESLEINSTSAKHLNVKHIIQQHFHWLKLDESNNEKNRNYICSPCWQALSAFHVFYERVEEAHKSLETQDIKPLERYDFVEQQPAEAFAEAELDETEIKLEPECTIIEPTEKPKRTRNRKTPEKRRGRSRNQTEKSEPITSCVGEKKILRKRISGNVKQKDLPFEQSQTPIIQVKTEILDVNEKKDDTFGDISTIDTEDILSDSTSQNGEFQDNNDSSNDDPVTLKTGKSSTCKNVRPKDWLSSEQCDKYITEHFNLSCCLCKAALKNFRVLKTHYRNDHQKRGYVMCCGKRIQNRRIFVDHLRLHNDPSYFKCERCDKVLGTRYCLEQHMKLHENVKDRKYECKECSKKFYWLAVYKRHMLTHLPQEAKNVPCTQCEKTFGSNYLMNQHLKVVHLNAYGKICDICGKSLPGRKALREHMEEHAGLPQPIIQCDICGLKLTSKYGLQRHIKVIHTEENRKPMVCSYCSQVSIGIKAHRHHVQYNHMMEPKHFCRICSKPFKRLRRMEEHMAIHTGDVLYTCPNCPETFRTHTGMSVHCKKAHPKEWEEKRLQRFNRIPQKSLQ